MKSLLVYSSRHHGNTKKLVSAIAEAYPVKLMDADTEVQVSLEAYDLIGFASGLDFGKFYPTVTQIARNLPEGKFVYALFTCAKDNGKYGDEIREIAASRNCRYLGKFGCKGYNTYGPWKLIGGMNKAHPSSEEIEKALMVYASLPEIVRSNNL